MSEASNRLSADRRSAAQSLPLISPPGSNESETNKTEKLPLSTPSTIDTVTAASTINYRQVVPGVAVSIAVMHCGFVGAEYLGQGLLQLQDLKNVANPISGIPVSIMLGMALNNTVFTLPQSLKPGIQFSAKTILQAGIICVGSKLSAMDLVSAGLSGIPAVITSVGVGMTLIPWLSKTAGLPIKMGSLIAIGTSICGITAITALAPAINATQRDTSFAVANVVAFGTIGMFFYPYLAHYLLTGSQPIGLFLGIAVHDTSHVLGTAMIYSNLYGDEEVLKVATITKLTRNLLLAAAVPYLTYTTSRDLQQEGANSVTRPRPSLNFANVKKYFPGFIAGFMMVSTLRSLGDATLASQGAAFGFFGRELWADSINFVGNSSTYLLGTAMAALGMSTSISSLRGVGATPFLVGMAGAGAVGVTGFIWAVVLGHQLPAG